MLTVDQVRAVVEKAGYRLASVKMGRMHFNQEALFIRGAEFNEYRNVRVIIRANTVCFSGCPKGFRGSEFETWSIRGLSVVPLQKIPAALEKLCSPLKDEDLASRVVEKIMAGQKPGFFEFDDGQTFEQIRDAAKALEYDDLALIQVDNNRLFACSIEDFNTLYHLFRNMP